MPAFMGAATRNDAVSAPASVPSRTRLLDANTCSKSQHLFDFAQLRMVLGVPPAEPEGSGHDTRHRLPIGKDDSYGPMLPP
jgi:hypothetical protein